MHNFGSLWGYVQTTDCALQHIHLYLSQESEVRNDRLIYDNLNESK